ncbi:uncharacterized protein METZ01_LOCUS294230 [marine metagenome]|uniref:Uncharacterized protein n=1 Tax=marine metagenome TaxID=408172 RepID=A0A382LXS4_9ZZZZ
MTRYRYHAVLLLFLLLLFATPVVGQEAGQRARGEIIPASVHFGLFPTSTVEGVLTPDLQQLEMGDGTIIARDDLINPEYFASYRPNFFVTVLGGGVVGVVGKFVLDQIGGRVVCGALSSSTPGESGYDECVGHDSGPFTYPVTFGLGAAVGASLWVIPSAWRSDWKPW